MTARFYDSTILVFCHSALPRFLYSVSVTLHLIVERKVLHHGGHALALHAAHVRIDHGCTQVGVLPTDCAGSGCEGRYVLVKCTRAARAVGLELA